MTIAHMADSTAVLRTRNLVKHFGDRVAVDNLDIEVGIGHIHGLLGPNGSGKSTTVGMVLGLVRPTSGEIEVLGKKLPEYRWEALQQIGAIIEAPAFYPYLTGRQNLQVLARPMRVEHRIEAAIGRVGLSDRADDKYHAYSLGMKQRLGIASTLLRDPRLIILDEPTNGLDPRGTYEVRELIRSLGREGRSVLLCSHLLHEVEQVCDTVTILREGVTVTEGVMSDLLADHGRIRVGIEDALELDRAAAILRAAGASEVIEVDGHLEVILEGHAPAAVNRLLVEQGIPVAEIASMRPSLESVFLEVTEQGAPDAA